MTGGVGGWNPVKTLRGRYFGQKREPFHTAVIDDMVPS